MKTFFGDKTFADNVTFSGEVSGETPTADSHLTTKEYVDGYVAASIFAERITLYVNPTTGDDANPGTEALPLQTIYGASKKVPPNGVTTIQLSAGTHTLPDFSDEEWIYDHQTISIGSTGRLVVRGTVTVLEQFTVASVTENVITAVGSPGWTVDEHIGKAVRWLSYGEDYPDFYAAMWVISNTANTITVCVTPSSLGGYDPVPTGVMDIAENASIITAPNAYNSGSIYTFGQSDWVNIQFDGTLGGFAGKSGIVCNADSDVSIRRCHFKNWSSCGVSGGVFLSVTGSMFDNCTVGIYTAQSSTIDGNNFFRNKLSGCAIESRYYHGDVALNHGCAAWMENIKMYLRIGNTSMVDDGSTRYWIGGTCEMLTELWSFAFYKFSDYDSYQIGMTGKDTFSVRVHYLWQPNAKIVSFNSENCTLKPDATFFNDGTTSLSLTDYVANGKSVEFESGTTAIG